MFNSRLKRLEKKLNDIAPDGMSKNDRGKFIKETSVALEMYLRATTKEEEQKANELQQEIDKKYKINRSREPSAQELRIFETWLE